MQRMFRRRNRSSLSSTIREATDPELRSLRAKISKRQETVAELELELFDLRASLEEFKRQLEVRVRPLERQLADLQTQLRKSRHETERRAQWGKDLEEAPDVVRQFERAWTPGRPPTEQPRTVPQPEQSELKALYRELAKRFHPDLTTDPQEKEWREEMMAEVNAAYGRHDLKALLELQQQPDRPPQKVTQSREQILLKMTAEVLRLDRVIAKLNRQLDELSSSALAQLQLDVSMARQSGQDLLSQIAKDLELEIAQAKAELASFT
ncbi:MAG: hypothetical protein ACE5M4_14755 [Anaerolineales bacterium]